jgi:hypothetical protein
LKFFSNSSVSDPLLAMKTIRSVTVSTIYYDSPFRISHNTPCITSNTDLLHEKKRY